MEKNNPSLNFRRAIEFRVIKLTATTKNNEFMYLKVILTCFKTEFRNLQVACVAS